ncbi:MAG: pseudouridine synthase [Patescibacteria group bacterium]|nr:rRNA pseudouridine synthase [Patescibacteria group bacterium]
MKPDSTTGNTSHLPKQKKQQKKERLQKLIAARSNYSRRKAEDLIREGQVFVNGEKAEIGQSASQQDEISINGNILKPKTHIYLALYKPDGYLSTTQDTHGRRTVIDLLPEELKSVKPAGRLDADSRGLLILSTDGDFIQKITHPSNESTKDYIVKVKGEPTQETLEKLTSGTLQLDSYTLNPMSYSILNPHSFILTLSEGRKRQIREVFRLLGHHVVYLKRLRVGPIELGDLKKGQYRHLTDKEILSFG